LTDSLLHLLFRYDMFENVNMMSSKWRFKLIVFATCLTPQTSPFSST